MTCRNKKASQKTVAGDVCFSGIGLHSGEFTSVRISSAPINHGIVFYSNYAETKAHWSNIKSTLFATSIEFSDGSCVSTIEHLLGALYGLGVTNAKIHVSGPEIPGLDGSALEIVNAILAMGIHDQEECPIFIRIKDTLRIEKDGKFIEISPSDHLIISSHCLLSDGRSYLFEYDFDRDSFIEDISPARTFVELKHIENMRSMGLIKGGDINSALVLHEGMAVNPDGERFSNECSRHKILDMIGDFALLGYPIMAKISASCTGHTLNYTVVRQIAERPDFFEYCSYGDSINNKVLGGILQSGVSVAFSVNT